MRFQLPELGGSSWQLLQPARDAVAAARGMTALLAELMGNCVPSRGGADPEEGFTYTALRHVRQSFSWDCGLACVMMVLQHKGMSAPLEETKCPESASRHDI